MSARRSDAMLAIASIAWLLCTAFALSYFLDFVVQMRVSRSEFVAIQIGLALLAFALPGFVVDRKNLSETLRWLIPLRHFSIVGTCALLAYLLVVLSRYPHRALLGVQHVSLFNAVVNFSIVLIEEVAFRLFLLTFLLRVLRSSLAIVIAGLVFGLSHIPAALSHHSSAHLVLVYLAEVTVFGFALGISATEFKSIWPGVVAHWLNNMLL